MTDPRALALFHPQSTSLFSSLPDEIVVDCLARISKSYYRSICLVSKNFYSVLSSPEIYTARAQIGATEPRLYVCLLLATNHHQWYTLSEKERELSLVPLSLSSSNPPARLNSTTVAVGPELYQIGGTIKGKRSQTVDVLDCRSHTWRRAPDMMVSRVYAKSCFLEGKIYVIGGCKKKKEESMNWGEVFDLKTQTWSPLPSPSDEVFERKSLKVVVFGARLYVITNHNNYAYDPKQGRWVSKQSYLAQVRETKRWVPELGFVDLKPMSGRLCGGIDKVMEGIKGHCCVIDNVIVKRDAADQRYKWYSPAHEAWLLIKGFFGYSINSSRTIQLVNYGGKLLILFQVLCHKWVSIVDGRPESVSAEKHIWCAVARLEKRMTTYQGAEMWGVVEGCNAVTPSVPMSCELSSCQSVSL